jgi:hypothetical protein
MPTDAHKRSLAATAWYDPFQIMVAAAWSPWGVHMQHPTHRARGAVPFDPIAQDVRAVADAQTAVVGELLRAPFWLTGQASPADLYQRSVGLLAAQQRLLQSCLDHLLDWQRDFAGVTVEMTERGTTTLREAVESQATIVEQVAGEVSAAQTAVVDASRATMAQTIAETGETLSHAAEQAGELVADTANTVAAAAAEQDRARVATRVIKGNITREGDKIYHLPGQASYERVQPEAVFATEDEAQAAGYRRSQAAGGGSIKGHISRDGERIYHRPGQANYDRLEADQRFETEAHAEANGFRPAQR